MLPISVQQRPIMGSYVHVPILYVCMYLCPGMCNSQYFEVPVEYFLCFSEVCACLAAALLALHSYVFICVLVTLPHH